MEVLKERPDIVSFVESVAEEKGIKKCIIISATTNQKGEGFLGQIFTITLKDINSDEQLAVVVKAAFVDEKVRSRAPIRNCFLNEICFYIEAAPEITKLEVEHGLPPSNFGPKCYKTSSETGEEKLCLENIKVLGFEVLDPKQILDDEHINFIFEVYGHLHAYTFALKEQKPTEYGQIANKLHNVLGEFLKTPNSLFKQQFVALSTKIRELLRPGEDDEIIKKFEKYLNDGIVAQFDSTLQEDNYSTLLHGDCWSNNLLFKYEEIKDKKELVDMRLLDLQLLRVGSPVCDLSYCLYSGASKTEFDNLDTYLKVYHESFSTTLKELGSDPEKIFPFDVLKQQWKTYSSFGMIMAFTIIQVKAVMSTEDFIDFTDDLDDVNRPPLKIDEEFFETRVKEVLYHMSEIDVL